MRFDPIDTFDPDRAAGGLVVRPRRWPLAAWALVTLAGAAAVAVFFDDVVFRYCAAPFLLLFAALLGSTFVRTGARRAWLLAIDAQGLSVMLRSPLRVPVDPREASVVTFPWREVAWVRPVRVTAHASLGGREDRRRKVRTTYLDVGLHGIDAAELAERIEAAQATDRSFKTHHQPATLLDGPVLRLEYAGPTVRMRPSIAEACRHLGAYAPVRPLEDVDVS